MKKKLMLSVAAAAILSSSTTVSAAPQYMADGGIFDPQWYLEQNPDVAASWVAGTSADALYMHYTMHGAGEGRKPFDEEMFNLADVLPYQGADATEPQQPTEPADPVAQQQPDVDPRVVLAEEGGTYFLPTIHTERFGYADCDVQITYHTQKEIINSYSMIPELEAAYAKPGYEWRVIRLVTSASNSTVNTMDATERVDAMHDYYYTKGIYFDESHYDPDSKEFMWQRLSSGWTDHVASFTARQDGVDYPGCQIFAEYVKGFDEDWHYWYAYVPENYDGELAVYYVGQKLENGQTVKDETSPIIRFRF
ncbi:MAG: hypothetical protein K2P63_10310 [Lachnospiraceae bacterium]|nr:hypothetical protein [Lachnospiraceae bacterium]